MAIKIGLDAGHGLKTAGKQTPNGVKEWTLNDKVRDKIVKYLNDYDCEIIHCDNDEGNTDESLSYRVNKYLNAKVDVLVSLHHNAFKGIWGNATGVEVYIDRNATSKDIELANLVYKKLVKYTGLKGRGVKKANFSVIYQNKIPAILVEGGFMDGKKDYNIITSEKGQNGYAQAVAEGLIEFLNIPKKLKEGWIKDNIGWWYRYADGTYTKNDWEKIDGKWYYFNAKGYAVTGYQTIENKLYYFAEKGNGKIAQCQLIITDNDGAII